MTIILYLILIIGLIGHGLLACRITGLLPGYNGSFYWFVVPHLVLIPSVVAIIIWDYKVKTRTSYILSIVGIVALIGTWMFSMYMWPGGDDGPGMVWFIGIGLTTLLENLLGIPILSVAHKLRLTCHSSRTHKNSVG